MKAVILAAGEGRRMRPLTVRRPKVMIPVGGKPLLAWLVERCAQAGLRDLLLVTHREERLVKAWFRDRPVPRTRIGYVHQSRPGGTGHALAAVGRRAVREFLLLYGDTLPGVEDLRRLAAATEPTVAAWRVADARPYGALDVAGSRLRRIVEKSDKPPSRLINAGGYRLTADFVRLAERLRRSPRGEHELTDAINAHLEAGGTARVQRYREWLEAGRPWDLLSIQEHLMRDLKTRIEGTIEKGVEIRGPVQIGQGTLVKSGTYLEGPVIVGQDCRIGPNAYLRPSTAIGDGCHVGASVEIKNSILLERTNVPHLSYVGDSILGADVNLGAGTNIANLKVTPGTVRVTWEDGSKIDTGRRKFGAIIGDNVKIGINCSLAPGTVVGNDCVIGMHQALSGWIKDGTRRL